MTWTPTWQMKALRALLEYRRTVVVMVLHGFAGAASAQATDLIISEYVEGSNTNKYIEVYNGTGADIDLSNYELRLYSNGASLPSNTATLSGILAAGSVIVYARSSSATYGAGVTVLSNVINFSGNDAIALYKNSAPAGFVDIFGNIGCGPSAEWSDGTYHTADRTLVRNANICSGIAVDPSGCLFPTLAAQWTQYVEDDVSHLGRHTMACGPTVNFDVTSSAALESAGSVNINLVIDPVATTDQTVYIHLVNGPGCAYGAGNDYITTPAVLLGDSIAVIILANAASAFFSMDINDDALIEGLETVNCTMTNATAGLNVGVHDQHVFTIQDNDDTGAPTVLEPGDILVVGITSSIDACITGYDDEISFICFKDITSGTSFYLTDNGYERAGTGTMTWDDAEGLV
ncbi:MAG: lamin tail domain-containing protein, partial [Flavobacteriales bacterium]